MDGVAVDQRVVAVAVGRAELQVVAQRRRGYQAGSLFARTSSSLFGAFSLLRRGELADAAAALRDNLELSTAYGYGDDALIYRDAVHAWILLDREGPEPAWRALSTVGGVPRHTFGGRLWLSARLSLLVADGRDAEALALVADLRDRYAWIVNPAEGHWGCLEATAAARLGRADQARDALDRELQEARAWGTPGTVGRVLRTRGEVLGEAGALEEAVALLEGATRRLELAKALAALGACTPGPAGIGLLQRAHGLATVCAAGPLARVVEGRLRDAGAAPDPAAATGPDALTRAERRVAALAADGRDAREIAQLVFATPREVQQRLEAVRRKVGDLRAPA